MKSKRAAERVLEQSTRLLEQQRKLKVNVAKSVIAPAATAVLLGYGFYFTLVGVRLRIAPKAWCRAKARIRAHVPAVEVSMDYRVRRLNQYVRGWMGYFRLAHAPEVLRPGRMASPSAAMDPVEGMETAADAVANLRALGVRADLAWQWGMSSRGYWRIASLDSAPGVADQLLAGTWCRVLHPAWARTTWRTAGCEARTSGGVKGRKPGLLLDIHTGVVRAYGMLAVRRASEHTWL